MKQMSSTPYADTSSASSALKSVANKTRLLACNGSALSASFKAPYFCIKIYRMAVTKTEIAMVYYKDYLYKVWRSYDSTRC